MTDKNSSKRRRILLRSIAVGSGTAIAYKTLPENWVKPVVNSVVLPAHAQASPETPQTTQPPTTIPPHSCGQCGVQLLNDGIGGPPLWDTVNVLYNFVNNTYQIDFPAQMRQLASVEPDCGGSILRLEMSGTGNGPLTVELFAGNTIQTLTFTGTPLTSDITIPDDNRTTVGVFITAGTTPYQTVTLRNITLTEIC